MHIGGTLAKPSLTLDNPDNLPLSQSDLLSYLITGEPAIALDNTKGLYRSQLASFALRYGGNLLTSAIPRNLVDIVELQTGRINDDAGSAGRQILISTVCSTHARSSASRLAATGSSD